jgi:hypothetical protein
MWGTAGSVLFNTIQQDHKFTHSLLSLEIIFHKRFSSDSLSWLTISQEKTCTNTYLLTQQKGLYEFD